VKGKEFSMKKFGILALSVAMFAGSIVIGAAQGTDSSSKKTTKKRKRKKKSTNSTKSNNTTKSSDTTKGTN